MGRLGRGDATQRIADRLVGVVEICQDLVVPKAQDAIAFLLQEITSLGFLQRGALMLPPVDFHDQPGLV